MIEAQLASATPGEARVPVDLIWVLEEGDLNNHAESLVGNWRPGRPPTFFMHTPFARRLLSLLLRAKQNRTWHVPHALTGSGKSTAIRELLRCFRGEKHRDGSVHMPIVAMRAPNRDEPGVRDFGKKLARQFGVVPGMRWDDVRPWLLNQFYECGVEQLIVDDAHECSKAQFGYIKELTDDLEGPPFYRRISVCLLCVNTQNIVPMRETFGEDKDTWVQFSRRLDMRHPYPRIADHDRLEVQLVLAGLDLAYGDRLHGLVLQRHAGLVYRGLTSRTFDPYATSAVTMDNLVKLGELVAEMVESTGYSGGDADADRQMVQAALEVLKQNRLAPTLLSGTGVCDSPVSISLPMSSLPSLSLSNRSRPTNRRGAPLSPTSWCPIQTNGYLGSCYAATWPMDGSRVRRRDWPLSLRSPRAHASRLASSSPRPCSTSTDWPAS